MRKFRCIQFRNANHSNYHAEKKHYLAWEWISCYNIANTSQSFHVGHGHSKDGQLVWFAGERATGGHHVTQFIDVRCHLVSPSSLNLTVAFSIKKKEKNSSIFFFLLKKHNKEGINELLLTSSILNYVCQFFKIANRCHTQVRFSSFSQARIGGKW